MEQDDSRRPSLHLWSDDVLLCLWLGWSSATRLMDMLSYKGATCTAAFSCQQDMKVHSFQCNCCKVKQLWRRLPASGCLCKNMMSCTCFIWKGNLMVGRFFYCFDVVFPSAMLKVCSSLGCNKKHLHTFIHFTVGGEWGQEVFTSTVFIYPWEFERESRLGKAREARQMSTSFSWQDAARLREAVSPRFQDQQYREHK